MAFKTFWLIWNPTGPNPTFRHESEEAARIEATRLARAYPGCHYVVMQAVASVTKSDVAWSEADDDYLGDEIPF